jgi:hypothetical protein
MKASTLGLALSLLLCACAGPTPPSTGEHELPLGHCSATPTPVCGGPCEGQFVCLTDHVFFGNDGLEHNMLECEDGHLRCLTV